MKKGKYCFNDPTVRCKDYINTNCVNYTGGNLINIQVSTNDTLTDILISLDEIIENIDGGITSDEKVKVSFNDTVAGYLNGKLIEGVGISLIENNNGGNETFKIINTDPDQVVVLTEGTNISITGTYPNFTISASGSGSGDVTGGDNVGVGEGVFAQKTGSILEFKSLIEGVGISLSSDPDEITIVNSAPDQVVVLTESTGIDITGTYPNFTITNSAPDQTVILTEGSGIDVSGTYPNFTITHEDTSTVSNLDTSNAQIIDTLTFDTFGHVQTVTTRNLTLSDLGYTPVTDTNFGNTNITFTGNRTHTVGGFNTIFNNSGSWTWNLPANNTNVFDVYGAKGVFFEITGIDSGQSYYGYYDLWPTFNEISLTRGTGHTTIVQNPSTAGSSTVISSKVGSAGSFIGILNTEIYIDPRDGELTIYSLPNISAQDRLIGQYSSTEKIGYITLGTGLSLAAGVLSSTGSYTDEQAQDAIAAAFAAGSHAGLTITYTDGSDKFDFVNTDLGSSQNIFKNIAVSGQGTVIADTNNDTLTLVAGTGVTITTDATTDSITINAGSSGTVNTGAALKAAYYPSAGTTVDDWIGVEFNNTNLNTKILVQNLADVGLEIRAAASQSANLFQVSTSSGTGDLFKIGSNGNTVIYGTLSVPGITTNSERFGASSIANNHCTAVGNSAEALGTYDVAVGYNATADSTGFQSATAVGANSNAAVAATAYGYASNATGSNVAFGYNTSSTAQYSMAIGYNASISGLYSVGIGANMSVTGVASIAFGNAPTVAHSGCIVMGWSQVSTAHQQFIAGSINAGYEIKDVYFGNGVVHAVPVGYTIHAPGGDGTDIAAANITIAGGIATGSAVGGYIDFITSDIGSSGTTAQSTTSKFRIGTDGSLRVKEITAPGIPPAGFGYIYEKSNNLLYFKNDAGTEYDLTATGGGGSGYTVHTIDDTDSPYTILETTGEIIILADSSGGAITVNVPTAVGNTAKYTIKLVTAGNTLTITPDGVETIDGSATAPISVANVALTFISDNVNLYII